jgi:hypothetical protein
MWKGKLVFLSSRFLLVFSTDNNQRRSVAEIFLFSRME